MSMIELPSRSVIYQGDLDALLADWRNKHIMDGECAKLPQFLTNVGHTSRWQPGPRVVELTYLLPGTVIANFMFDSSGRARYPNQHGYHAGLFHRFSRETMSNGRISTFRMIDQWAGNRPKHVGSRLMGGYTRTEAPTISPCDNANDFYVVVVP